jgi:starch-binding outer membrane protein, SusD/RagB family
MMINNMRIKIFKSAILLAAFAGTVAISSCRKLLDVEPENVLTPEQTYRNVFDADAAVVGVYGKFMTLAKPYMLLNELRADLMTVTNNADVYLQQLNKHTVTEDNPYVDPTPFYQVILQCNDVMKNFDIMLADKKMKVDEYSHRYSDVAALRSWVYLQLGIHFSKDGQGIPYVTDALEQVSDVKDETKYPILPFPQLLAELIKTVEGLPFKELYPTSSTLVTTVDQYATQKFFINKNVLLGELHLWNGAYDPSSYTKSATALKSIIDFYSSDANGNTNKNYYKIIGAPDPNTLNQLAVQYVRYRETDINALAESNTEGWRSIFSRGKVGYDQQFNWEWIWTLPFNRNFAPGNPFIDLFSNRLGSYLVKPSQKAIDDWNSQVQFNGFPFDARGRFTYKIIDGQPVIMKHLYYVQDGNTFLPTPVANGRTGDWFLYRSATAWQHFGEAANRDGHPKLAYAIINQGLRSAYTPPNPPGNVTDIQQTFLPPPYDFDARSGDNPQFRAVYRDMAGLRGRASLQSLPVSPAIDSTTQLEAQLVDEAGRELAYEGQRWADLLRVAIRRGDASFLTSRVADQLEKDGYAADAARVRGLSLNQLYLPLKWK